MTVDVEFDPVPCRLRQFEACAAPVRAWFRDVDAVERLDGFSAAWFGTGEVVLYVVEGGDGPPLLLIPGSNEPWHTYAPVLGGLARRFRVIVADLRGHGLSGRPYAPEYRVIDHARDVECVLRHRVGEPAFVSGNSLGGLVGLRLAATARDVVRGLSLEDAPLFLTEAPRWQTHWIRERRFQAAVRHRGGLPADRPEAEELYAARLAASPAHFLDPRRDGPSRARFADRFLAQPGGDRARVRGAVAQYLRGGIPAAGALLSADALRDRARKDLRVACDAIRTSASTRVNEGFDHAAALAAVRAPTLLWEADRELVGLYDEGDVERALSLLRGAAPVKHIHAERCGHAIHRSRPGWFADTLTGHFLAPAP